MVWDALHAPIERAIHVAIDVLGRVLARYDGPHAEAVTPRVAADEWNRGFDLGLDTLVRQQPSRARVADLAFMASFELRQKKNALERLEIGDDGWCVLEALDGGRRRVRKTITAVATMLAEAEGYAHQIGFASEVETSLQTRRAYAKLRRSIGDRSEPTNEELVVRLRGVGTQIAMLIGRRVYADLRVGDRVEIRGLQARILDWLRNYEPSPATFLSGRRLWQDLAGFSRVIDLVSQRQELIEHDAHVLTIACASICNTRLSEVPAPVMERVGDLLGLDDELDALLDERCRDPECLCPVIERLRARVLRPAEPPTFGSDPIAWEEL